MRLRLSTRASSRARAVHGQDIGVHTGREGGCEPSVVGAYVVPANESASEHTSKEEVGPDLVHVRARGREADASRHIGTPRAQEDEPERDRCRRRRHAHPVQPLSRAQADVLDARRRAAAGTPPRPRSTPWGRREPRLRRRRAAGLAARWASVDEGVEGVDDACVGLALALRRLAASTAKKDQPKGKAGGESMALAGVGLEVGAVGVWRRGEVPEEDVGLCTLIGGEEEEADAEKPGCLRGGGGVERCRVGREEGGQLDRRESKGSTVLCADKGHGQAEDNTDGCERVLVHEVAPRVHPAQPAQLPKETDAQQKPSVRRVGLAPLHTEQPVAVDAAAAAAARRVDHHRQGRGHAVVEVNPLHLAAIPWAWRCPLLLVHPHFKHER